MTLYVREYCVFCHRVIRAMEASGHDVEVRNVWHCRDAARELKEGTGRHTVPVLRVRHDDGSETWMPESVAIIRYLAALEAGQGKVR